MKTRFLHTSDWQLGVTRHFLDADAQARWSAARFDGVRNLGRIAKEAACEFIVVAGDVFESNQIDRRTLSRACEAMASIEVPIYLLPANHDPLDASCLYTTTLWRERKPAHVHVLAAAGECVEVRPGIEVVGAPWTSKRPLHDLVAAAAAKLEPAQDVLRVLVGHGVVDPLSPDRDNPAVIQLADAERAISERRYHYLALGDRHSYTAVGTSGRIFYSGTHETYDFREVDPGKVLIVDLDEAGARVDARQNGNWCFAVHEAQVSGADDVRALARAIDAMPDKERTVLKLGLVGTLDMKSHALLEDVEARAMEMFAAVLRSGSRSELAVIPDDADFEDIALAGFANTAVQQLREQALGAGSDREAASDALALLVRLVGRSA